MKKIIPIAMLVSVLIGIELIYLAMTETNDIEVSEVGAVVMTGEYWSNRVATAGGAVAYAEFIDSNAGIGVTEQHTNAHIFGEALYDGAELEGAAVCDSSFSFGCYHAYLGQAIYVHGIDVVLTLNEVCVENLRNYALSCQHGIGHGILSYLGYNFDSLMESLSVCEDLPYSDPIGGCYGGLFMEYNMRTMLSVDGVGTREVRDTTLLHEPCSELEGEYLPACYYWQPQWWLSVLQTDLTDAFVTMGKLCTETTDEYLNQKCFEGIGNIAPQSAGYDPIETIALCEAAGTTAKEELYCKADAANSFHAVPEVRDRGEEVCAGLEGEDAKLCFRYSTNEFNQANPAS